MKRQLVVTGLIMSLFAVLACPSHARVIYVDDDAKPGGDGSSWQKALRSPQQALGIALPADQIRVAQGIYRPDQGISPGDVRCSFTLVSNVALLGGYAGLGNPDPDARNPKAFVTYLTGDLAGDDAKNADRSNNSYHVVTAIRTGPDTVIEGFVVTAGNAYDQSSHQTFNGGGIYVNGGALTIRNCTLLDNRAGAGGGVYCEKGRLIISDCILSFNHAQQGAAVFSRYTDLQVQGCTFEDNSAYQGGGIYVQGGTCSVAGCQIRRNRVHTYGGGVLCDWAASVTIANTFMNGNRAGSGGAVCTIDAIASITNCTITGNRGYDVSCLTDNIGSDLRIMNSIIWNPQEPHVAIIYPGSRMQISFCNVYKGQRGILDLADQLIWAEGNIDQDPLFAQPGYWDTMGTPEMLLDDIWIEGDYHLRSETGRWDPKQSRWIRDNETSPCIDAGDPAMPVGKERFVHGNRINMGAYGGTVEASQSPYRPVLGQAYSGGAGTAADPFIIAHPLDLIKLADTPSDYRACFAIIYDLEMSVWPNALRPIANADSPFCGTFDGQGHCISELTMLDIDKPDCGLFGVLGTDGLICNLVLVKPIIRSTSGVGSLGGLVGTIADGRIQSCHVKEAQLEATGNAVVGGLAGINSGLVQRCSSTGQVKANNKAGGLIGTNRGRIRQCFSNAEAIAGGQWAPGCCVGGLVAENLYTGITGAQISDSYATGRVSFWGTCAAAGLVGYNNSGHIINCYAAGPVKVDFPSAGLVAYLDRGLVINCFWDMETSGHQTSAAGIGKTTAQMRDPQTFLTWGPSRAWTIKANEDYPRLWWEDAAGEPIQDPLASMPGTGTQQDPYLIDSAESLSLLASMPSAWDRHYALSADIQLVNTWILPIGNEARPFTGSFDGRGHTIYHLTILGWPYDNGGLFGLVDDPDATICNLNLVGPRVVGQGTVFHYGALVGRLNNGRVYLCSVLDGLVGSAWDAGGLVGFNTGSILKCPAHPGNAMSPDTSTRARIL